MKNNLLLSAIIATSFLIINSGCAKPYKTVDSTCDATIEHPCLVQDSDGNIQTVKNYRDGEMLAAAYQGNINGLKKLWMSGSVTPTKFDLQSIANHIFTSTNGQVTKIVDLDLREESHALVNGYPITLTTKNDWINLGKSRDQIIIEEKNWQTSLLNQKILYHVLSPTQFKNGDYTQGNNLNINSVTSEESAAQEAGFSYVRLTISDHMAPKTNDVDQFVALIDHLPANTWLYLHCRGGKGRTTTFLAMYDMLNNADKVSFDDIIKRQASVAPFEDLSVLDKKNPDLMKYYQERYIFLKKFYLYAQARKHGYHGLWSTWTTEQEPL